MLLTNRIHILNIISYLLQFQLLTNGIHSPKCDKQIDDKVISKRKHALQVQI